MKSRIRRRTIQGAKTTTPTTNVNIQKEITIQRNSPNLLELAAQFVPPPFKPIASLAADLLTSGVELMSNNGNAGGKLPFVKIMDKQTPPSPITEAVQNVQNYCADAINTAGSTCSSAYPSVNSSAVSTFNPYASLRSGPTIPAPVSYPEIPPLQIPPVPDTYPEVPDVPEVQVLDIPVIEELPKEEPKEELNEEDHQEEHVPQVQTQRKPAMILRKGNKILRVKHVPK